MNLPTYLPIGEYLKLPVEERMQRSLPLSKNEEDRASELRRKLLFIDIHNHVVQLGDRSGYPKVPWDRIDASGLNCLFETVVGHQDYLKTVQNLGTTFAVIDQEKKKVCRVTSAEDIRVARREGRFAFLCDMEVQAAGAILDRVDLFYGLGVRAMGLTYNTKNFVGDGFDERTDSGLSYFGLQLVDRMNKLGMMVSIAHAGLKTAYDTIEYSRDPVMLSHIVTSVSYYHKSRPDELLKACAERGGIIGIETIAHALPNMKKSMEERKRAGIWDVLDQIEHAIEVAGIDHVCIGSDNPAGVTAERGELFTEDPNLPVEGRVWYGPRPRTLIAEHARMPGWKAKDPNWPYAVYTEGLNGVAEWQNITRGLVSRGFSDQEIANIVGENAARYIERVIG